MNSNFITFELCTNFLIVFNFITAIIGTIYYYKYSKTSVLKYFLLLLYYFAFNELFAKIYSNHINLNNSVFFNISQVFEFTFFLLLYKNSVTKLNNKKWISIFLLTYYISFIINCFLENFVLDFYAIPYCIGSLFTSLSIILYFLEILNSDKIVELNKSLIFWISIGMFIFYIPSIPFWLIRRYYENFTYIPTLFYSIYFLGFFYNLMFIIGFIWSQKQHKQ